MSKHKKWVPPEAGARHDRWLITESPNLALSSPSSPLLLGASHIQCLLMWGVKAWSHCSNSGQLCRSCLASLRSSLGLPLQPNFSHPQVLIPEALPDKCHVLQSAVQGASWRTGPEKGVKAGESSRRAEVRPRGHVALQKHHSEP